jgi:hypothetical protein
MTAKRLIATVGALALIAVGGVLAAGTVAAQTTPPEATPQAAPGAPPVGKGLGRGLGMMGGGWTSQFDAVAKALNLTPAQLFEQLHSGKSLSDIAAAQGVDLAKVQEALNADRIQAMKDAIAQAVKDGKMTQAQADWLLQGLEKGYMPMGRGGFGFEGGRRMHGGMGGRGARGPQQAPAATPAPGTSS